MARALLGAVAAAVAMFILGFIFFATPLQSLAVDKLDDSRAAAVQQALNANVQRTGTYFVPDPGTPQQSVMYGTGGVATVHYNSGGFAASDTTSMIGGFVHMLIVTLLMAAGLYGLSRHAAAFADQVKLLVLGVIGAAAFMRLGEPVWYHHDWGYAIYMFLADSISLIAAGIVILKLLPRDVAAAPAATTPAGSTSEL
jgi:hypothetical protein